MKPLPWSPTVWISQVQKGLVTLRELDDKCPTRLVYGGDYMGRLTFGFITKFMPDMPVLSEAVSVERAIRHDSSWILLLRLEDSHFQDVFVSLCDDIYRTVRESPDESAGMLSASAVLQKWRQLFEVKGLRRLSIERCRGLFAELSFGFEVLAPRIGTSLVVEGWQGPFGSDQDYDLGSQHFEVKSKHASTRSVQIASEYQLHGNNIVLVTIDVENSEVASPAGISLAAYVADLRNRISMEGADLELFDSGLAELGFDIEDKYYESLYLTIGDITYYSVTDAFPKIIPSTLPLGVSSTSYKLEIERISAFQTDPDSALTPSLAHRTGE